MWRDPISVETAFQSVCSTLPFGGAGGLQVRRVADFVRSIDASRIRTEPYLVELTPQLSPIVRDMDAAGLDPADLQTVFDALRRIGPSAFPPDARADFEGTLERLRRMLILQYAYAGDLRRVLRYLDVPAAAHPTAVSTFLAAAGVPPGENTPAEDRIEASMPPTGFEALADSLRPDYPTAAERLDWAVSEWNARLSRGGAVVPVMESYLTGDGTVSRAGLLRFHIAADRTIFAPADLQLEIPCDRTLRGDLRSVPVHAAAATRHHDRLVRIPGFRARLRWNGEDSVLCGRSALLAVAVLYFCAVVRQGGSRILYRVRRDAAFSAAMNPQGDVLRIDASTLAPKVKAAFFSWVNILAVPAGQAHSAQRIVDRLRRVFPNRHLEIAPASHLDDVLGDPRLVEIQKTPLRAHLARLVHLR